MSAGAFDVTVSIVSHSSRDDTLRCLASLADDPARRARAEVVVLDNASDDGSVAAIRAAHPGVAVIAQDVRRGFGANHNAVIRAARGRHVFVLNNDTLVAPGTLDALVDHLDAHPSVGAAGPRVVWPDGSPQLSAWTFPTVGNASAHLLRGTRPAGSAPAAVGYVSGCALMARAALLAELGGFDEDYFMYAEEKDLCRRMHAAGYAVHLVPAASVTHLESRSSRGVPGRRENEFWRSQRLYLRKHHSRAGALAIELQTAVGRLVLAGGVAVVRALPARLRPREVAPELAGDLARQARSALVPPRGPGLRELAEEYNEHRTAA